MDKPSTCMCGAPMRLIRCTYEGKYTFIHNVPTWVCDECGDTEHELHPSNVVGRMMTLTKYAMAHGLKDIDYDTEVVG